MRRIAKTSAALCFALLASVIFAQIPRLHAGAMDEYHCRA